MYSLNLKVFFSYVQSDKMHKAGLRDMCMRSEIMVKPILKPIYYSSSVYGYYLLL